MALTRREAFIGPTRPTTPPLGNPLWPRTGRLPEPPPPPPPTIGRPGILAFLDRVRERVHVPLYGEEMSGIPPSEFYRVHGRTRPRAGPPAGSPAGSQRTIHWP